MKYYLIVIITLLLSGEVSGKKMKGWIINGSDTTEVVFLIPVTLVGDIEYSRLSRRVSYIDASGEKRKLKPTEAKEYIFRPNESESQIRMVSIPVKGGGINNPNGKKLFARLEADGIVKLYDLIGKAHYLQRENGNLLKVSQIGFKKQMAAYFSDCSDVVQRIKNNNYSYLDIFLLVTYYNGNCIQN